MEDFGILQPLTALLILSLTTEKIANVIKLWNFPLKKQRENDDEKKREKRNQAISVCVGIGIALIAKANLFEMFTSKDFYFFWENETLRFSNIMGSILTGGFLSFGSQFFHDLISILFQIKSTKTALKEKLQQEIENQKNGAPPSIS